ncbi:MAG: hypothetical protein GY866_24455 [Proteobacteria bacterium]|nr:hypothetical protein [Pseudomonadota bacterium]
MKKIIIAVSVAIVAVLIVLSHYGLFASIRFEKRSLGPFILVYEKHLGDYAETGVIMDRIYYRLLNEDSISSTKGFGIYYDKPGAVAKEEQRSIAGCILEGLNEGEVAELSKKYRLGRLPASEFLATEFPHKGQLSVLIGVLRVYPEIAELFETEAYPDMPIVEIYDGQDEKINYLVPLNLEPAVFDAFIR